MGSVLIAGRFGANLLRARKQADLTQEEVAFRTALHRTEVGLLERGERTPRIDTLVKLAGALGVKVDCALLEGIDWKPPELVARGGFAVADAEQDAEA